MAEYSADTSGCSFYITHPTKSFVVACESSPQKNYWLRELQRAVTDCKKRLAVAVASVAATAGGPAAAVAGLSPTSSSSASANSTNAKDGIAAAESTSATSTSSIPQEELVSVKKEIVAR